MYRAVLLLLAPVPALAASTSALAASGRMLLGLLLVLGLLGGALVLLRRLQRQPGASAGLRALAALSVGTRERVVLLEIAGRQLLVGVAPGRVQTLLVLDSSPGEGAFARRLDEAIDRREVAS